MFLRSFQQIRTEKLTMSGTAKPLITAKTLQDGAMDSGRSALEVNNVEGSATVYVGNKDVTTSTGIPVEAGQYRVFPVQFGSGEKIYGVGGGDVIIAEYF